MTSVFKILNWLRVASNAQMRLYDADELTLARAMRLLYYVQGTHLALYGKKAFTDEIIASEKGPIVPAVQRDYQGQTAIVGELTPQDVADYQAISETSSLGQVLNAVWLAFGDLSTVELVKRTHTEKPWRQTTLGQPIAPALMAEYFTQEIVR
ncbi:DUF4065 domain-containing protein [Lactiplantibacillus sp. WILCCON 0030]|uniref:DUF4065 domain-containing protein n=2 Tax=Lactiplantibacillus brownii TaxID=3069269 RepID=A0ABU1ACF2_9LACO|nr:type II toxin-antitoxin system antitoxin SocA domain-containing protein [Lactiplantibacillus brownii]MDQ7938605.1 DUF4065 domain-containing protein [Lactiplantibacillus brownii]